MANKKALELLKSDIDRWNYLRVTNADEEYLDLTDAYLIDAELSNANLSRVSLRGTSLIQANLQNVDLKQANLDYADFREANLHQANLSGASLIQTDLRNVDLSQAILTEANLSRVKYDKITKWPSNFNPPESAYYFTGLEIRIHLEGFPPNTSLKDVEQLMEPYGEILSMDLMVEDTREKLHVFVDTQIKEGQKIINSLNGFDMEGYKLRVHRVAKILFIDDDRWHRRLLELVLMKTGYQCVSANDGKHGLEYLQRDEFIDLCIIDLLMPGMDGWEISNAIRTDLRLDTGIIIISARTSSYHNNGEVFSKINGFLVKPVIIDQFIQNVEKVLSDIGKAELICRINKWLSRAKAAA